MECTHQPSQPCDPSICLFEPRAVRYETERAAPYASRKYLPATGPRMVESRVALDEMPPSRPPGATDEQMRPITALFEQLDNEIVEPSLGCSTPEEYIQFVREHRIEVFETLHAVRMLLMRMPRPDAVEMERAVAKLIKGFVRKRFGNSGVDELDFVLATYQSAMGIVARFPGPLPETSVADDRRLAEAFNLSIALEELGTISLIAAAGNIKATDGAVQGVLELMREAALKAYSSARMAFDLREEPEDESDGWVDLSDEEFALAEAGLEDVAEMLALENIANEADQMRAEGKQQ